MHCCCTKSCESFLYEEEEEYPGYSCHSQVAHCGSTCPYHGFKPVLHLKIFISIIDIVLSLYCWQIHASIRAKSWSSISPNLMDVFTITVIILIHINIFIVIIDTNYCQIVMANIIIKCIWWGLNEYYCYWSSKDWVIWKHTIGSLFFVKQWIHGVIGLI